MKRILALIAAVTMLCSCASGTAATASSAASSGSAAPAPAPTQTPAPAASSAEPVAENWVPSGPVTMIVAYKEGSSTDVGARLFMSYAEKYLSQSVTIKNIASNSGQTAWKTLAESAPDGTTLGFINMPNIFTAIDNGGGFTIQDFSPVCTHVIETSVVVVPADSPYDSLEELISANRAASEAVASEDEDARLMRVATNGVQASNDIAAALLAYSSGAWKFQHVAYGSTGDQLNALLTGECEWSVAKVSDILQYVDAEALGQDGEAEEEADADSAVNEKAGTLRALALFDTDRCKALPGVPTTQELGFPTGWYGSTRAIVAPAGTDPAIIQFYADAFEQTMEDAECIAAHEADGLALSYMGPEALAIRMDERARFNAGLLPKLFAN